MHSTIIIIFCVILLSAYLLNLFSSNIKIPDVILLLFLGWSLKIIALYFEFSLPDFSPLLEILATIGLVLIVLEGSIEVSIDASKIVHIKKSFITVLITMLAMSLLLTYLFWNFGGFSFRNSLINAIPICIICSDVAIPSVRYLTTFFKDYAIYESSLSDIVGILFFNFIDRNEIITIFSFTNLTLQIMMIFLISFFAIIALIFLLKEIKNHVKNVPIILLIIFVYTVLKLNHLPALLFLLLFGLSLANITKLKRIGFIKKLQPYKLRGEIQKFAAITIEFAFLARAAVFILFGYLIEINEIINLDTLIWSLVITAVILVFRIIQLKINRLPLVPMLFVVPRGLVTILLFLSIDQHEAIGLVNKSLIVQLIVITALILTFGLLFTSNKKVIQQ